MVNSAAIRLDLYCQKNEISDNTISDIGGTGILLAGYGPGTKDANKNNVVVNNEIQSLNYSLFHLER